jgi:hypothetical protein
MLHFWNNGTYVTNSKIILKKVKDKATIKTEKMRIHVLIIREFGVRGCAVGTEKKQRIFRMWRIVFNGQASPS